MRNFKTYFSTLLFAIVLAVSTYLSGCVPFDESASDDPCVQCEEQKKKYVPPTTYIPPTTYTPPPTTYTPPPTNYTPINTVIQLGAFVNKTYADNFMARAKNDLQGYFIDMKWNKKGFYQIVTGEYNNLGKAEQDLSFVKSKGYNDAFIKETKYLQ
ncbi:MAG: SPOR domain-containing protein [Bacteroidetes bacterium]|nr:SPOR domain-containing protein [Bacteroidota bacterium]